jgi:hypothetical protein
MGKIPKFTPAKSVALQFFSRMTRIMNSTWNGTNEPEPTNSSHLPARPLLDFSTLKLKLGFDPADHFFVGWALLTERLCPTSTTSHLFSAEVVGEHVIHPKPSQYCLLYLSDKNSILTCDGVRLYPTSLAECHKAPTTLVCYANFSSGQRCIRYEVKNGGLSGVEP